MLFPKTKKCIFVETFAKITKVNLCLKLLLKYETNLFWKLYLIEDRRLKTTFFRKRHALSTMYAV